MGFDYERRPEVEGDRSSETHVSPRDQVAPAPPGGMPPVAVASQSAVAGADRAGRIRRATEIPAPSSGPSSKTKRSAPRVQPSSGLPEVLRAGIEQLSGISLDDVRVHRNSGRPARVGALAYAQVDQIHLGPGQDQHLPHEAWHLVQQRQGRVRRTTQYKGEAINEDAALEREADIMGGRALAIGRRVRPASPTGQRDASPRLRSVSALRTGARVLQLLNRDQKKALDAVKKQVSEATDPKARWRLIHDALERINAATEQNIKDGAKYLKVQIEKPADVAPTVVAKPQKKRTVDDTVWEHITQGGLKEDGRPTGYHTTRGTNAIAEGFGQKTMRDFDCYEQQVRLRSDPSKVKKGGSTFFPDSWTLEEIREAIEYAVPVGQLFEVVTPLKGAGMRLRSNDSSWYPCFT